MATDMNFDWAIAPLTTATFFAEYFEAEPLHVMRQDPDYFTGLLSTAEMDRVVCSMGLSVPEISMTQAGADLRASDYAQESGLADPTRIARLYAEGATLILSGLQERLPRLGAYCRALEAALSCRVQTNAYLTPARSQGFRPHYDSHDVLVLQVEGTKEWRLYDRPVDLPLQSQAFDPDDVAIGPETAQFLLQPGDALYVPRGLAHDAVATDEASLHITTGLMFRTWADLLTEAVSAVAHRDADFRKALPPGFANPGFDVQTHESTLAALLGTLVSEAPLEKLLGAFKEQFLAGRVPRVEDQIAQLARLDALSLDSLVGGRPHLLFDLTRQPDETVRLICQGAEMVFPGFVETPLTFALTENRYPVSALPGDLDDDAKLVLIRRLVREGLVQIH